MIKILRQTKDIHLILNEHLYSKIEFCNDDGMVNSFSISPDKIGVIELMEYETEDSCREIIKNINDGNWTYLIIYD